MFNFLTQLYHLNAEQLQINPFSKPAGNFNQRWNRSKITYVEFSILIMFFLLGFENLLVKCGVLFLRKLLS